MLFNSIIIGNYYKEPKEVIIVSIYTMHVNFLSYIAMWYKEALIGVIIWIIYNNAYTFET